MASFREMKAGTRLRERLEYTVWILVIFLLAGKIPLYGIEGTAVEQLDWTRDLYASSKGTLMELGVSPIMTAFMLLRPLLSRLNLNFREEQKLERMLSVGITFGQAILCVCSGMYGPLGIGKALLVFCQVCFGGLLVIWFNQQLNKGYGICFTAGSLFTAANLCESIIFRALSPFATFHNGDKEYEGAIVALFHGLFERSDKFEALKLALFRGYLPNVCSILSTIMFFLVVVYLMDFSILVTSRKEFGRLPIELFYNSTIPVQLLSSILWMLHFLYLFGNKLLGGPNWFVNLCGGLVYYMKPLNRGLLQDPVQSLIHVILLPATCGLLSRLWVELSRCSSKDVAQQVANNLGLASDAQSDLERELGQIIPTVATLGGLAVGFLCVIGDVMGAIGSGAAMLLVASTLDTAADRIQRERFVNLRIRRGDFNQLKSSQVS